MLIIGRKKDEKIVIGDEIEITIVNIGRHSVRIGIKAPEHITVTRPGEFMASQRKPVAQAVHGRNGNGNGNGNGNH